MPETHPGEPPACGPSSWLQQRLVQHERLQCLLRWPHGAPRQALFPSGARPNSHRLLCEAVGRRPLLPAVCSYPSDIQLFLGEEAHFWQLLDLDSRKFCPTPFLFVSNQQVGLYHFPLGCVCPPAALTLSLAVIFIYATLSSLPVREEDLGPIRGGDKMQGASAGVYCCPDRPKWQLGRAPTFPGMHVLS